MDAFSSTGALLDTTTPSLLPKNYGLVLLTLTAISALHSWNVLRVGQYRRAASIPYPQTYALPSASTPDILPGTPAYIFNCAQRAHVHMLENVAVVYASVIVGGLGYPVVVSVMGAAWVACRVVYARGYTNADPKVGARGRLAGIGGMHFFPMLGLMGVVGWMGVGMVWEGLMK